jgi:hypothetical protein
MMIKPQTAREVRMNQQLGKTLGKVNKEIGSIEAFLDDPITRMSGCADEFLPDFSRRVLERIEVILRDAGYANFKSFLDEVEERTSPKWAYFYSGIEHLEDINGQAFWREGRGL